MIVCPICKREFSPRVCVGHRLPVHDKILFEECPGSGLYLVENLPVSDNIDNGATNEPNALVANVLAAPPLTPPKRTRKPKAVAEPASEPNPSTARGGRLVANTELIAMYDAWEAMADMPTAVKRRIVDWLVNQVREEESAKVPTGV